MRQCDQIAASLWLMVAAMKFGASAAGRETALLAQGLEIGLASPPREWVW